MVQLEVTGESVRKAGSKILLLVLVIVALVCVWSLTQRDPLGDQIKENRYQAVILSNDRVYFGHLTSVDDDWYELSDAHFIREKPADADAKEDATAGTQEVAPISEELTQPDSSMLISSEQIVQVQNLKRDSRVSKAIESLKK